MLSDADAASVVIALALCFKTGKESPLDQTPVPPKIQIYRRKYYETLNAD
jgi:hypothetical protein